MNKLEMFLTTILIMENLLLFSCLMIWLNRHCQQCQQVKCLERIFNKACRKCKEEELKL